MAWNPINDAEVQVNKPVVGPGGFGEKVKDNLNYLYGQIGTLAGVDVPNGSFEIDSDADGVPDQWTVNLYPPGGASQQGLETVSPAHGAQALKFVHPGGAGEGGGYADSDYVPCSELFHTVIRLAHWATAAGMHNKIVFRFFDSAKVDLLSDITIYDSMANPTAKTALLLGVVPPANACFFKLRLVGGDTDASVAGSIFFDGIEMNPPGGQALNLLSEGTFGQVGMPLPSYFFDVTSFTIKSPVARVRSTLKFHVEMYGISNLGGDPVVYGPINARYKITIGTDVFYSKTFSFTTSSFDTYEVEISLPVETSMVAGQNYTVLLQAADPSGLSSWITARKTTTDGSIRADL